MSIQKKIKSVRVTKAGSPPDVDTDFHTKGREDVIKYCVDKYGEENVANIITYGAFKAKNSWKSICTLYGIPFALANRVSSYIPNAIDNEDVSITDLLDEDSARYSEGLDFRNATSSPEMSKLVDMAIPLDGRVRGTGVHPCGLIISNRPLSDTIPTQVRQSDGTLVTQWTYPQCESIGLIKMDMLGLDTLDIIQSTLETIELVGKEVPDMREIVRGEMDDEKTFKLLQEGNTVGIFQLGGAGVRDLLKRVHPTEFGDIAATTALYRPGPMKMGAHIQYADRKNGREEVHFIRDEFEGSPVEDILGVTYGLIVYQEQCMQLATEFAGMTGFESDELRKAISKKNMGMMMRLRPKFIDGIVAKGYSEEGANILWDTIAVFGEYGFNKSHSYSYAINAYKTCYLKAHYPAEFMAALLQQNTGEPKKIVEFIQEANSMGLNIGPVDINLSQRFISASPDSDKFDIIYGLAGVKQVSDDLAQGIVTERNKKGPFKSVADFLKRMEKTVKVNGGALRRLAQAGAFDCFGVSRKTVTEKSQNLTSVANKPKKQSFSMFDIIPDMGGDVIETIALDGLEFPYNELIKRESESLGFFVSGHPTSRAGLMARQWDPVTLMDLRSREYRGAQNVLGTITLIDSKPRKDGSRSIAIRVDDGRNIYDCFLPKPITERIEKGTELRRRDDVLASGKEYTIGGNSNRAEVLVNLMYDDSIKPIAPLETNEFYRFGIRQVRRGGSVGLQIVDIEKIDTAYDGSVPYEIVIPQNANKEDLKALFEKHKGGTYVFAHKPGYTGREKAEELSPTVRISRDFIRGLESIVGANNIITKGI